MMIIKEVSSLLYLNGFRTTSKPLMATMNYGTTPNSDRNLSWTNFRSSVSGMRPNTANTATITTFLRRNVKSSA
jgi:hypothetical protein